MYAPTDARRCRPTRMGRRPREAQDQLHRFSTGGRRPGAPPVLGGLHGPRRRGAGPADRHVAADHRPLRDRDRHLGPRTRHHPDRDPRRRARPGARQCRGQQPCEHASDPRRGRAAQAHRVRAARDRARRHDGARRHRAVRRHRLHRNLHAVARDRPAGRPPDLSLSDLPGREKERGRRAARPRGRRRLGRARAGLGRHGVPPRRPRRHGARREAAGRRRRDGGRIPRRVEGHHRPDPGRHRHQPARARHRHRRQHARAFRRGPGQRARQQYLQPPGDHRRGRAGCPPAGAGHPPVLRHLGAARGDGAADAPDADQGRPEPRRGRPAAAALRRLPGLPVRQRPLDDRLPGQAHAACRPHRRAGI